MKIRRQDPSSALLSVTWHFLLTVCIAGAWSSVAQEASDDNSDASPGFQVVVNAANPVETMEASSVAKIFLKKIKRWEYNESITPIDLGPKNPVREVFTRDVHGKSVTAIKSFWQRMIFSARGQPPEEKSSAEEVLEFVRTTPGGIGYVAAGTPLGDDVKELKITP